LKTKNIKEIEKKQEIIIGNFIRNNFYYLKYNPQNQKLTIKEININNLTIEDKISIEYQQDNFIDIFDLTLFGVLRVSSLKYLNLAPDQITNVRLNILSIQMLGMLIGGILW
jgi:hypothetical protein